MTEQTYRRMASLKTAGEFRKQIESVGVELGFDDEVESGPDGPLGRACEIGDLRIGNRFCILPMEGWDGTPDGRPTELTIRRWRHFGESGAKLIWGGEAVAVRHDGKANPNQLVSSDGTTRDLGMLREELTRVHREKCGTDDDLLVGLQLTHSGRFARPTDKKRLEPRILYHHPVLDRKFGIDPGYPCLSDGEIGDLIGDFVRAAVRAEAAGFRFVDLKHCHGYLGHEFLSSKAREGRYGGSFENRTRFLRELIEGVRREAPGLLIGVRLSAFDMIPFRMGPDGRGVPEEFDGKYDCVFGADPDDPLSPDLGEAARFLEMIEGLGIKLVCITAGSPYYNPHIQRPALFPPSDGYRPPEDPILGVARQIGATAELKKRFPGMCIVGSGYSYLQEWLPNVGQYHVRNGMVDFVGLGRMVLSYPEMPLDVLAGRPLQTRKICRTFSDCTTAPRNGLVSGCYPLDPFYRAHPDNQALKQAKEALKTDRS